AEEGLENVFARHRRHGEAARRAVRAWGLEVLCLEPAEYSGSLTAVLMPAGHDADAWRAKILAAFDMSLGTGLGGLAGKVFRIGHLGHFNDLSLAGTLAGVEMGLALAKVPHQPGGVQAALDYLAGAAAGAPSTRAECTPRPARADRGRVERRVPGRRLPARPSRRPRGGPPVAKWRHLDRAPKTWFCRTRTPSTLSHKRSAMFARISRRIAHRVIANPAFRGRRRNGAEIETGSLRTSSRTHERGSSVDRINLGAWFSRRGWYGSCLSFA